MLPINYLLEATPQSHKSINKLILIFISVNDGKYIYVLVELIKVSAKYLSSYINLVLLMWNKKFKMAMLPLFCYQNTSQLTRESLLGTKLFDVYTTQATGLDA